METKNEADRAGESLGVVITGGSRGLGWAMAKEFLLSGDRVVVCGRHPGRLEAALKGLKLAVPGAHVHGLACDVSSPSDMSRLSAFAVSHLGSIHRWINNAGTAGELKKPLWELDAADIDETCRTNLVGTLLSCAEAVRIMRMQPVEAGKPVYHIFNMGFSAHGARFSASAIPHKVSKTAVAMVTALLERELRRSGNSTIGVHELSPGLVLTDLLLKDATKADSVIFNAIAEEPEIVAATLVPLIRMTEGSHSKIRYRPVPEMALRMLAALTGIGRKQRFFDREGRRVRVSGKKYRSSGAVKLYDGDD
jgi:NAD(P)-dependent dehydrogenase (short-subunit alcohol dehydrogenase family)